MMPHSAVSDRFSYLGKWVAGMESQPPGLYQPDSSVQLTAAISTSAAFGPPLLAARLAKPN